MAFHLVHWWQEKSLDFILLWSWACPTADQKTKMACYARSLSKQSTPRNLWHWKTPSPFFPKCLIVLKSCLLHREELFVQEECNISLFITETKLKVCGKKLAYDAWFLKAWKNTALTFSRAASTIHQVVRQHAGYNVLLSNAEKEHEGTRSQHILCACECVCVIR